MSVQQSSEDAVSSRVIAYLVDFVLLTIVSGIIWAVFAAIRAVVFVGTIAASNGNAGGMAATGGSVLSIVLQLVMWVLIGAVLLGYLGYLQARSGQTLGQRLLDVSVVDASGGPITLRQGLIRNAVLLAPLPLMALVSVFLPFGFFIALGLMVVWLGVELAMLMMSDEGQRLGDRFADTFVVESA